MTRYVTVCLPRNLTELVDKKFKDHGYTSRADFVKQAIRNELRRLS